MELSGHDSQHLLFCAAEVQRGRRQGVLPGSPGAPWLLGLVRRLELEVATSPVSRPRQDDAADRPCSEHEDGSIGSREAAAFLGWTTRQVQRRATDLNGHKLASGQYIFCKSAVHTYREAMNNG